MKHERFIIFYLYKIKGGLVPNISITNGLTFRVHSRAGCKCNVPHIPISFRTREARDGSFAWTARSLIKERLVPSILTKY